MHANIGVMKCRNSLNQLNINQLINQELLAKSIKKISSGKYMFFNLNKYIRLNRRQNVAYPYNLIKKSHPAMQNGL